MKSAKSVVVFRTTCSLKIGLGHLRRCLTLADALRSLGYQPAFALAGDDLALSLVETAGYPAKRLDSNTREPAATFALLQAFAAVAVIIDDYALSVDTINAIASANVTTLALDDFGNHSLKVDLVWNGAAKTTPDAYAKIPAEHRLLGPTFALLASPFATLQDRTLAKSPRRVLITFGGSDPLNLTATAVELTRALMPDATLDVVIGPLATAPFASDIRATDQIVIHRAPSDLAALIATADLAITAGGQTCYELAAGGVPSVAVEVAANQRVNLQALGDVPTLIPAAPTADAMKAGLKKLLADPSLREILHRNGRALVDGKGARRTAAALAAIIASQENAS